MKILVIGANGTVGRAVTQELAARHTIIKVGKTSGDYQVDLADTDSIIDLYKQVGTVDAVVCAAGSGCFIELDQLTPEAFATGLNEKMHGQINLVLLGQHLIAANGSFTLISGVLSDDPIKLGVNSSTINAAIDGFVRSAAIELKRGVRINAVSPTLLTESEKKYEAFFRGFTTVDAAIVAKAFSKSVEGHQTGQIYKVL